MQRKWSEESSYVSDVGIVSTKTCIFFAVFFFVGVFLLWVLVAGPQHFVQLVLAGFETFFLT
jgi:hypothetical protein